MYQSKENEIVKIKETEKLLLLLSQVIRPNPLYDKEKWDLITNKLLNMKILKYGCNMEKAAVDIIKSKLEE